MFYGYRNVILGTVITFCILLLYTRLLGKKQMSQITYFNYITGITLGSLCANTISGFANTFGQGIMAISVWVLCAISLGVIILKSLFFKLLIDGKSTIVIKNGVIQYKALKSLRLNINDLMMLIREEGIFSITEVDYAILEPNGRVSILKKVNKQNVTKEELKLITIIPKYMPTAVITDGSVVLSNLKQLGLKKEWLLNQIENLGIKSIKSIKYAEIQADGSLFIDFAQNYLSNHAGLPK